MNHSSKCTSLIIILKFMAISMFFYGCSDWMPENINTPAEVSATDGDFDNKIAVNWTQENNTKFHRVYRSDTAAGEYRQISGDVRGALYNDESIIPERIYYYKIKAFNDDNGESKLSAFDPGHANLKWIHPKNLSDSITPDAEQIFGSNNHDVEMDGNGNYIIVWVQRVGYYDQLFIREYRDGIWGEPFSFDALNDASYPEISMDDKGDAIVAWFVKEGDNYYIYKSEYRKRTWGTPVIVSENAADADLFPRPGVAMDNNGNAIIVWIEATSETGDEVYFTEFRNESWSTPASLSGDITPIQANHRYYTPSVAMDDNGNVIVVWWLLDGSYNDIYRREYRNNSWGISVRTGQLDNNNENYSFFPVVSMNNQEDSVIAWEHYNTWDDRQNYQIFTLNYHLHEDDIGWWGSPSSHSDNINPDLPNSVAKTIDVAMDDNGDIIIVWCHKDSEDSLRIYKSEYRNGQWINPSSQSDFVNPSGTDANYSYPPKVAMDDHGNAIIVWNQYDETGLMQIFKSEYRQGAWSNPSSPSDNISPEGIEFTDAFNPYVKMNNNGNAIIVWDQRYDSVHRHIYMSELKPN